MKKLILAFICLLLAVPCQARIIFVDANTPDNNDGSSWAKAYKYLQDALADANSTGDVNEIRVAHGIYTPDSNSADPNGSGDREATFQLINGVTIKGGFAGFGQPEPNARDIELYETILSGDLDDNDEPNFTNNSENSYNVVTGTDLNATAVLGGFTITAGNANGSDPHDDGGGMWNDNSSPTITNCTFSYNSAGSDGGGMYNYYSSPTVTNCTFTNNSTRRYGGGMCNYFYSSPTITNCTFSGNSAKYSGGGMANRHNSSPTVSNCTFSSNSARDGGGMYNYRSSPTVNNCTFSGNSVQYTGGGMSNLVNSSPTITNCTFSGNSVQYTGGGMYNYDHSNPTLTNCTFSGNSALNGNATGCDSYDPANLSNVEMTDCILWDGGQEIWNNDGSTITISYTDLQGGQAACYDPCDAIEWALGNIDADPCFVEPGYWADANDPNIIVEPNDPNAVWIDGDYHLLPGSPCIDAGDPNYIPEPNETDLDGNPRIIDGNDDGVSVVDMGAYEFYPPVEAKMKLTPQMLNCNSKGKYVKAHLTLPQGFLPEDVDVNEPAVAEPIGIESEYIKVLGAGTGPVRLEIAFDREAFCAQITETGEVEVTVIGSLTTGRYFYATDTITIIPGR